MGFGIGILLVATGAILAWAVEVDTTGFDINTAGYILMGVGAFADSRLARLLVELGRARLLHARRWRPVAAAHDRRGRPRLTSPAGVSLEEGRGTRVPLRVTGRRFDSVAAGN